MRGRPGGLRRLITRLRFAVIHLSLSIPVAFNVALLLTGEPHNNKACAEPEPERSSAAVMASQDGSRRNEATKQFLAVAGSPRRRTASGSLEPSSPARRCGRSHSDSVRSKLPCRTLSQSCDRHKLCNMSYTGMRVSASCRNTRTCFGRPFPALVGVKC